MKEENPRLPLDILLRISPVLINLLFCFVVYGVVYGRLSTYTELIDWDLDFRILLGFNFLLIILEPLFTSGKYIWSLFVFRCIVLVILAIPYPHTFFLDSFLITGLFFSFVTKFDPKYTFISAIIFLLAYFVIKLSYSYFYFDFKLHANDVIFFIAFFSALNLLFYIARFSVLKYSQYEKNIEVLQNSIKQLSTESSHFLNYAANAEEQSSTAERKRITRDLHDIIGKTFTDIIMMMEANIRHSPDDKEELKEIFTWVGEQSRYGLGEIRKVLYDLRSSIKEEPVTLKSLLGLIESFKTSSGIDVVLNWSNARITYGRHIDLAVYRIVQESLVNALRHGRATKIQINFWEEDSTLTVTVQDNGESSKKGNSKGIGQTGMEERLQDLDGSISFSRNSEGYLVRVIIPVRERD